jgi:transposase
VKLQEKVYRLREENKRLKAKLRHQERKITEGYFGSSTPSSKKPHKVKATQENQSKTGGAQRGHRGFGRKEVPVEEADEVVTLDAPESCPDCGTSLTGKGMRERGVIDLEPVTIKKIVYRLKRKRCPRCQRTVQAPIPGVMPKCLYSNRLLAHVAVEHYVNGLTLGYLEDQTGVGIGALIDGMHHLRRVLQSVPDRLIHDYRQAAVKQADETGWSSDGVNGYAWLFCTPDISIYRFRKTRSGKVPQAVLEDKPLPGVLVVDRYNGYNRSPCKIQYCYVHLLRKVRDLEKEFPQNSEIAAFVQTVKPLLKNAINLRTLPIKDRQYYELARKTKNMLVAVMTKEANHPGIQEIQNIFRENPHRLYHWVDSRNVPSDNNRSERELRPLVIARKISFGSQSDEGLKTREVLMTVLGTLYKRYPQDVLTKLENFLNQYALNPNIDPYLFLFNYTS